MTDCYKPKPPSYRLQKPCCKEGGCCGRMKGSCGPKCGWSGGGLVYPEGVAAPMSIQKGQYVEGMCNNYPTNLCPQSRTMAFGGGFRLVMDPTKCSNYGTTPGGGFSPGGGPCYQLCNPWSFCKQSGQCGCTAYVPNVSCNGNVRCLKSARSPQDMVRQFATTDTVMSPKLNLQGAVSMDATNLVPVPYSLIPSTVRSNPSLAWS